MEEVSQTIDEMQQRIASKLRAVGANSRDKAVTAQAASLDFPEQNWLGYIAGGLFTLVKKPQDNPSTMLANASHTKTIILFNLINIFINFTSYFKNNMDLFLKFMYLKSLSFIRLLME